METLAEDRPEFSLEVAYITPGSDGLTATERWVRYRRVATQAAAQSLLRSPDYRVVPQCKKN